MSKHQKCDYAVYFMLKFYKFMHLRLLHNCADFYCSSILEKAKS